jgi:tetratricopeptide (TPR) repeat protein
MNMPMDYSRCALGVVISLALMAAGPGCAELTPLSPFAATRAGWSLQRGEESLQAKELDKALAEFQNALEFNPKLAVAHSRIGWIARLKGDLESAARAYSDAVRLDPESFDDAVALAQVYHQLVRFTDAVRAYIHACQLRPDDFEARLNLGVCYHQAGELEEAIDCYVKAIELDPSQPASYTNLGAAYDAQHQHYEAIRAYNRSLERDPHQPMVLVNLATTLMKQERYASAWRALERAVEMDPGLAVAYERLGYCYFHQRDYAAAARNYEWAATLDPKMPEALAGLGVVRMAMHLQNPQDVESRRLAVECWHRSLELRPDQPRIRNLVKKYQRPGDDQAALLLGR